MKRAGEMWRCAGLFWDSLEVAVRGVGAGHPDPFWDAFGCVEINLQKCINIRHGQ